MHTCNPLCDPATAVHYLLGFSPHDLSVEDYWAAMERTRVRFAPDLDILHVRKLAEWDRQQCQAILATQPCIDEAGVLHTEIHHLQSVFGVYCRRKDWAA